jgi:hypothetical protein
MTTSVTIRPAGHHVRVTTTETYGAEPVNTAHDLAPGDPERVFYVHGNMGLKVEEFDPSESEN